MMNIAECEAMAIVIKAMAHPTRLFLMQAVSEREHCVCELAEMVGADVSTVSRHFSILKSAGIVEGRKHNNQVFYHLIRPCLLEICNCVVDKSNGLIDNENCSSPTNHENSPSSRTWLRDLL